MNIESLDPKAFAPTTREDWLKLVNRALKGADFQETLVSHTDDGIAIEPLYGRRPDAQPLPNSRGAAPWTIAQRMDDPDTRRALAQLGDDLANGATGICLVSKTSPSAFGTGIDTDGFAHKLAGAISGKAISLRLDGCSPHFVETFVAALDEPSKPSALHLGLSAFAGKPDDLADAFLRLQGAGFAGTILNADGRAVHSAGGTEAQELAVMAATLAGHLRMMERAGVAPDRVLDATSLCLAADQNQFVTMAKARAARLIFTRIAEVCGISNAPTAHLFMETSYRMLTKLDPETNILRNTVAVFAAGTGGADEISVLPHTLTHGIPDPLARRLARNTQTILLAESHLDHVTDPAAGAGGIEALTDALAEQAWEIFTGIDRDGGLTEIIANGRLAAMVAEARINRVAKPIVGTTLFAMKTERPVETMVALRPFATGLGLLPVRLDEGADA